MPYEIYTNVTLSWICQVQSQMLQLWSQMYPQWLPLNVPMVMHYTPDLEIRLDLLCAKDKVKISITYANFSGNWFGIVFNDEMRVCMHWFIQKKIR